MAHIQASNTLMYFDLPDVVAEFSLCLLVCKFIYSYRFCSWFSLTVAASADAAAATSVADVAAVAVGSVWSCVSWAYLLYFNGIWNDILIQIWRKF